MAVAQVPWMGNGKLGLGHANPFRTSSPFDSLKKPTSVLPNLVGKGNPLGGLTAHRNRLGGSSPLLGNPHSRPGLFDRNEHQTFPLPTTHRLETPEFNLPKLFDRQQQEQHYTPPSFFNKHQQTPSLPPIRKQTHCSCYCDI